MGWSFLKIIKPNCDPSDAQDKSLPYNAYLVTYETDDETRYDLVLCNKKVEIFDYYWDRYREGLITFVQSEGRVNPKLYDPNPKPKKKK